MPFATSKVWFAAPDDDTTRANQSRGWDAKPRIPRDRRAAECRRLHHGRHPRGNRDPDPDPADRPGVKAPASSHSVAPGPKQARGRPWRGTVVPPANATRMTKRSRTNSSRAGWRNRAWCASPSSFERGAIGVRPSSEPRSCATRPVGVGMTRKAELSAGSGSGRGRGESSRARESAPGAWRGDRGETRRRVERADARVGRWGPGRPCAGGGDRTVRAVGDLPARPVSRGASWGRGA